MIVHTSSVPAYAERCMVLCLIGLLSPVETNAHNVGTCVCEKVHVFVFAQVFEFVSERKMYLSSVWNSVL